MAAFTVLIMVYSVGIVLMIIIEIFGTVLFSKLLRSNTMDLENNMVKYSRDELLEVRKSRTRLYTKADKCENFKVKTISTRSK